MKRIKAVVACVALVACTPAQAPSQTPTPSPSASAVSPSASPNPAVPSSTPTALVLDEQQQAAVDTVQKYYALFDTILKAPLDEDLTDEMLELTYLYANPEVSTRDANRIHHDRAAGIRQVGEITFAYGPVSEVTEIEGVVSVQVTVCADSSAADRVDAEGNSVKTPDDLDYVELDVGLVQMDGAWLINNWIARRATKC